MKKEILLLSFCGALTLLCALLADLFPIVCMIGFVLLYLLIGWKTICKAVRTVLAGQMLDEHFLMTVATIGAFCIGEYTEAVAVMLFYRVGELFERAATRRSRRSISDLMHLRPDCANLCRDADVVQVSLEEVAIGDVILVRPGEKVPLDGTVEDGATDLNTAPLTGEALPRHVEVGQEILSGCVNLTHTVRVRVTKTAQQSTVTKILEMVEHAAQKKSKSEAFITRFARYYTPCVTAAALLLAVLPPLFLGNWALWTGRALSFLVVSCPCALVISVPLAFFGGIGGAARKGILMKGGTHLETLAKASVLVCDKTGTLTTGRFSIVKTDCAHAYTPSSLLALAARAEADSSHPISASIAACAPSPLARPQRVQEIAGQGVIAQWEGSTVCVGNLRLMQSQSIRLLPADAEDAHCVFVSENGNYAGRIYLEDTLKEDAGASLASLKKLGIAHFAVLTGDDAEHTLSLQAQLHPDAVYAKLLPNEKVSQLEQIMDAQKKGVLYVGDGINDAPVLCRADVGIAMGALGSDAAMEAADIVLMNDRLSDLVSAKKIAKKTRRIAWQNTVFALGVKACVLLLCAFGVCGMWAAVFADVGVSVLAICNSMRLL